MPESVGLYLSGVHEIILHMSFAGIVCLCIGWGRSSVDRVAQPWRVFIWGGAFALLTIVNMLAPAEPIAGLRIDIRSALILLASVFGGGWAAAITGLAALLLRGWLGGPFAVVGQTGIALATFIAIALIMAPKFGGGREGWKWLVCAGLAVGISGPAASFLAFEPQQAWTAFIAGGPLQTAAVTISTLLFAQIILRVDQARSARERERAHEASLIVANQELERLTVKLERSNDAYRRAQEEAESISTQFRLMMQHAPVGMFVKDTNGVFVTLNEPEARLFNRKIDEVIGRRSADMLDITDGVNATLTDQHVLETKTLSAAEYRISSASGMSWILSIKFPMLDAIGNVVAIGGFDLDISDRKRNELGLRRTARQLERVQQNLKAVYWSIAFSTCRTDRRDDQSSADTSGGAGIAAMTGWSEKEATDYDFFLANCIHADDRARMGEIYRAFRAGEIDKYVCEYRLTCKDGSVMPVKVWVEKIPEEGSGDALILGVLQDISEHRDREMRLAEASARAEISERVKADFLANLSHELRTPLNAVIGFSDILKIKFAGRDEQLFDYADDINRSGYDLLTHVNDLLDVANTDFNPSQLVESAVPVMETVSKSVEKFSVRAQAKGVIVFQDTPPGPAGVSGITVRSDKKYFRKVLDNLLSNAVKFTDTGGKVSVRSIRTDAGDLSIVIEDTGCGIPAERMADLATPFVYGDAVFAKRHGGIGIGLTVCKRIMDMHGGRLDIESREAVGTRVTATFPAERVGVL